MCLSAFAEHVRPAGQQRIEQQETGDDRALEAGGEPAGERQQLERDAEQQDEEQAPEELRAARAARSSRCRRPAPCACRARGTERARPRCRGCRRSAWRAPQARSWPAGSSRSGRRRRGGNGSRCRNRRARTWPSQIRYCCGQRLVEAHLVALGLDLGERRVGRQRHRGRIDRQQAQDAEQQRRDDEQDDDGDEDAARDSGRMEVMTRHSPRSCRREGDRDPVQADALAPIVVAARACLAGTSRAIRSSPSCCPEPSRCRIWCSSDSSCARASARSAAAGWSRRPRPRSC